ncbi:MAG: ClpXP protease specificity-enhancing factor SspB [Holosporales bacterium]|jgi:hypothetical protein|nr:ClpXP protease specificity-enhancing factor SspB [Holosporales bacterium]
MMQKKIEYDLLVKKASISVVRDVLRHVASYGLYKKQHLYITFAVNHPGVKVASILKDDGDDEMTIVLQYEFWDLLIDDYGFSVSLSFEHSDESLYIPFSSLMIVSDPSEDFCLEFIPNFDDVPPKQNNTNKKKDGNVISIDSIRNNAH